MTLTLSGADIRGFYDALGIGLPGWSTTNVPTSCFADPDAHAHADRHPSTSVNLTTGAWRCHGCGAAGGAYDAALRRGHDPRSAIELMIRHGLIERCAQLRTARELVGCSGAPRQTGGVMAPQASTLRTTEADVRRWQSALGQRRNLIMRLARERGWRCQTMRELGLGWDRGRITIPVRDRNARLRGVLRYRLEGSSRPKMLAVPGSRLGLMPHPTRERASHVVLVEGPPDMLAARSHGLPAIAVPGDHAWKDEWADLLAGREITIVMDADPPGRAAARRIADDLAPHAEPRVVELAADRDDGYDLTDWILELSSRGESVSLARLLTGEPAHAGG